MDYDELDEEDFVDIVRRERIGSKQSPLSWIAFLLSLVPPFLLALLFGYGVYLGFSEAARGSESNEIQLTKELGMVAAIAVLVSILCVVIAFILSLVVLTQKDKKKGLAATAFILSVVFGLLYLVIMLLG